MTRFARTASLAAFAVALLTSSAMADIEVKFTDLLISSVKTETTTTLDACKDGGGKVVTKNGKQYCELPIPKSSSGNSR